MDDQLKDMGFEKTLLREGSGNNKNGTFAVYS